MEVHHLIEVIVPYLAAAIELLGIFIILYGCAAALFLFFRARLDFNNKDVKLELAQALALALEFKLAAEILKSVVVQTIDELILLAAIVALRVVMTLLIHWEIKTSEQEGEELRYRQQRPDTLADVYLRSGDEGSLRDRWRRRTGKAGEVKTSAITSSQGKESRLYTHTLIQDNDDSAEAAAKLLQSQAAPPQPSAHGSTYETHGPGARRADGQFQPEHLVMSHSHTASGVQPDESLTSMHSTPQRPTVTREEDGLTVTIERQIQRLARRRRQVNQSPKDDVKDM